MRIRFFGDSFVNGTGDDDCLGWPGRPCAEARQRGHDVTLYNLDIRRDTSGDVARRWERETSARLPLEHDGRLVVSFGVNDCVREQEWPKVSEDASVANTRATLARARARWPTLMFGPPCTGDADLDQRVERWSERIAATPQDFRWSQAARIRFDDPRSAFGNSRLPEARSWRSHTGEGRVFFVFVGGERRGLAAAS